MDVLESRACAPMQSDAPITTAVRSLNGACVSIIVPAYNEAQALPDTLRAIAARLNALVRDWEIIVIDDGSTDGTADAVRALPPAMRTSLIQLSRNFGKEAAISAGLHDARGQIVICMDADGQHPVDMLDRMLALWQSGYEMVYAVREDRSLDSRLKRWGVRLFYRMLAMDSEIEIPPDAGDFRLMDRRVVDALNALPERSRFMKGLYAWVGFRSIGLPYAPLPRTRGVSSFSKFKLLKLGWTGLTGFSTTPLRIASAVGLVFSGIAFTYGVDVVFDKLFLHESIPGWPTVVVSIMFFAGIQLISIGVLGEYLARIFEEVKARPLYIVSERLAPRTDAVAGNPAPTD